MPEELKWESLKSRRINSQLKMFDKIINKLTEIRPEHCLSPGPARTR